MRRNMQLVLEKWGGWAFSEENCSVVDWQAISAGFKSLLSPQTGGKTCSDDDGIMIDSCIARLRQLRREDEMLILALRYIAGYSQRDIATTVELPRAAVERHLQAASNFVEGCLAIIGTSLDMDPEVRL
ncbi:antiterminator Q family protein [Serratia marcescens]|uniref:antiterminator Q family protein n=1 Tax=Serratia marcescens TaxID=615 RepID=UPI003D1872A6